MDEKKLASVNETLAPYGYRVDTEGHFHKGDKKLSVRLEWRKDRYHAIGLTGIVVWSGPEVEEFDADREGGAIMSDDGNKVGTWIYEEDA